MKSFLPKPRGTPPDDEGPDDPFAHNANTGDQPAHVKTDTRQMHHSNRCNPIPKWT